MSYTKILSDNINMIKNVDKFYNPFTKRFIKKGTKSYLK